MGYLKLARLAVALGNKLSKDLQATVLHKSVISTNEGSGDFALSPAVSRQAVVEMEQKVVKTADGETVLSRATVTFLDPTVIVNLHDEITLPDGTTGPILNIGGFPDRILGTGLYTKVSLG